MPAFRFQDWPLYAGRTNRYQWKIYDLVSELPVAIALADVVRAKLSLTEGGAIVMSLDLSSDPTEVLPGGSEIVVEDLGSINNPDPANDRPATGHVYFAGADTLTIGDSWGNQQTKAHWLDLSVFQVSSSELKPFGRGRL